MRSAVVGGKSDGVTLKSIQRTDDAPSVGHAVASATSSLDTHDTTTVARYSCCNFKTIAIMYET